MKNVFISERMAAELPEWVPYLLWYAVADNWQIHGAQQHFHLKQSGRTQCIRHTQGHPPLDHTVTFPCSEATNAEIIVQISDTQILMMLAEETNKDPSECSGRLPEHSSCL